MSTFGDTLAGITSHNHELGRRETFGHLAPRRNQTYVGYVIFAVGCFGDDPLNPMPLDCEFKNLDSSPWFYDELMRWLSDLDETKPGGVYRFDGVFKNYEFTGTVRKLTVVQRRNINDRYTHNRTTPNR